MAWRSLILFKCNAAWNRYIDERCHITNGRMIYIGRDASWSHHRLEYLCASIKPEARSIDRESINHGLEKRIIRPSTNELLPRCFLSLFRGCRLRFPRFPTVYLALVFRPSFLPPGKGRNLAVGMEVEESLRSLWIRSTWTTSFCYVLFFPLFVYFVEYLSGFSSLYFK